jgi:hypothetical protein
MKNITTVRQWAFFPLVAVLSCLGVFVVPFWFPAPALNAVSVSNAYGFNNKVASLAAGCIALAVFFLSLRAPADSESSCPQAPDRRRLENSVWLALAALVVLATAAACWLIYISGRRYHHDIGYFVNQMTTYADYHFQLYSQIQFFYGPLLFYPPILLRSFLSSWHVSMLVCYMIFLCLNQFLGICFLSYTVNALPMSRRWKIFALLAFGLLTLQPMLGVNYTLFRFLAPVATLIFITRRTSRLAVGLLFVAGAAFCLSISSEIGLAFTAGAMAYGILKIWRDGRAWFPVTVSPLLGCAFFLLLAGKPFLSTLTLFAHGTYNMIVEPLPHVLVVLLAAVWLIPRWLARPFRERDPQAPFLGACFVLALTLLPVAFGRADPLHVLFDGATILLLSMAAISRYPRGAQVTWAVAIAVAMAIGHARLDQLWKGFAAPVLKADVLLYPHSVLARAADRVVKRKHGPEVANSTPLDLKALLALTGGQSIATPLDLDIGVEDQLKRSGLYRPDAYFGFEGVLDDGAEQRKIDQMNQANWALLPTGFRLNYSETEEFASFLMGARLPYRPRFPSYVVGNKFQENLATVWSPVGVVNEYTVYHRKN